MSQTEAAARRVKPAKQSMLLAGVMAPIWLIVVTVVVYVWFTVKISDWRMKIRRAMNESEYTGEHRSVAANSRCLRTIAYEEVLESSRDDRDWNQELDERGPQVEHVRHCEGQRQRMADSERRRDPEAFTPISKSINRREREEEENVVGPLEIGDMPKPKLDERGDVRHGRASRVSRALHVR